MSRRFIWAIAGKEFTENVLSRRFQIALGLATLLMVTSVTTLALNYKEDEAAHQLSQSGRLEQRSFGGFNEMAYAVADVLDRPNPLAIFAGGPGASTANRDDLSGSRLGFLSSASTQSTGGSDSPTTRRFAPLDLAFVSVVIMTFMAVIFAYDAVSGERERGTLKLMLSNPVPKDSVLVGKYLGGMASVLLPFGISVVVGLALFQFLDVQLSWQEWGRLSLIILLFVPLASAFYLLGLLFSSLFKRSNTSLLALLLVWLLLVFGAGNVAATAAKTTADTTTDADLLRTFDRISEDEQSQIAAINEELAPLYQQMDANGSAPPATQARINELQGQMQQVWKEKQREREEAVQVARRQLDRQLVVAESIAMLSPAEAYKGLVTALARTDYWSFRDAADQADLYVREVDRLREEWQQENQQREWLTPVGGGPVGRVIIYGGDNQTQEFEPPAFAYRAQTLGEQLSTGAGVTALTVLLVYNLGAFLGAYFVFLRYDVR